MPVKVVIASKFGFAFKEGQRAGKNSTPDHIRRAVEGSLKRLRVDAIDLYYLHRLDPNVPIKDLAGTAKNSPRQGKSEISDSRKLALQPFARHAIQPVSALQIEYSVMSASQKTKSFPPAKSTESASFHGARLPGRFSPAGSTKIRTSNRATAAGKFLRSNLMR